ncbi:SDR family NAD(P)-dependent oxidoreductase [Kitasatospora sp. McL0602]|uniref:SDR family NAD(P)-dependent oxidoreductase n=1 Tax=Kitasatospora sp. McL0602 TaxID=3439530 RepID=UPI003F8C7EFE
MTETARRLTGRVAVVTGAGSGLGAAVAKRLAAEGAKVVCADPDEPAGRAIARAVKGLFVHADLADADMVEALYDEAYETCGGVDIAFHVSAAEVCCRFALAYMRRHGRGSIINLSGAEPGTGALSVSLARQYAREGIRVNTLRAGGPDELAAAAVALLAGDDSALLTASEFVADEELGKITAAAL